MHTGWKIAALLGLAAFALGSLVAGAGYLQAPLPGGLPLGNALAALGFSAIAGTGVTIARRGVVRRMACVALLAALAWLPVSIAMAGNLTLVFQGARGDAWIAWSVGVAGVSLAAPVLALSQRLFLGLLPRRMRAAPRGQ